MKKMIASNFLRVCFSSLTNIRIDLWIQKYFADFMVVKSFVHRFNWMMMISLPLLLHILFGLSLTIVICLVITSQRVSFCCSWESKGLWQKMFYEFSLFTASSWGLRKRSYIHMVIVIIPPFFICTSFERSYYSILAYFVIFYKKDFLQYDLTYVRNL